MAITTPRFLSASANGRGVMILSTLAASGTLLHTSVSGNTTGVFDEIYVYLQNLTTVAKKIIFNAGGTTSGDKIRVGVPAASNGLIAVTPGLRFNNSVLIRAYATSASKVSAFGYVNRTA